MYYKIRRATRQDMPKVLDLIKELAVYEKEPEAVKINVDDLKKNGFGKDNFFTCFVAEVNHAVIGIAIVYPRFSTWLGKALHLEDLIVTKKYRGKGIGLALYKYVMTYAKSIDVKRVEWEVLNWNTSAITFYKKTGAKFYKDWYLVQLTEPELSKLAES